MLGYRHYFGCRYQYRLPIWFEGLFNVSRLVLASASPRRQELLALLTREFQCIPADADESVLPGEPVEQYVSRLAQAKAEAVASPSRIVLGSDTTVCFDGELLHKPEDYDDAYGMLERLSGQTHQVYTGVAMVADERIDAKVVKTEVVFDDLSRALIETYLSTSDPWDKAGAYGIQGFAGCFVSRIKGSFSAVMGLPLSETRQLLTDFGVRLAPALGSHSDSHA